MLRRRARFARTTELASLAGALGPGPRALGPVGPLIAAARHIKLLYNIIAAVVGLLAAVIGFLAAVVGFLAAVI